MGSRQRSEAMDSRLDKKAALTKCDKFNNNNEHAVEPSTSSASLYGSEASFIGSTSSIRRSSMHLPLSRGNLAVAVPLGASHLAINTETDLESSAPPDRFSRVYMIFLLQGISFLLPWNMFLTANNYFTEFKLAPTENQTESEYAKNFLSYAGIAGQVPNVIFVFLNIFIQSKSQSKTLRIAGSIGGLIFMFILTIILAMVDSQTWQGAFFGVTMASIVIINVVSGIYQSSAYGMAGPFPMKYTNALVIGSNSSGIFTSITMIVSLQLAANLQVAAIWYFITAVLVLCLALIAFCLLPSMKFYKHFSKAHVSSSDEASQKFLVDSEEKKPVSEKPPYCHILAKTWIQLLGIWLTFFVSLTCFPAIQADINPSDPDFFIPDELYAPITTFLFFNLFATLGNLATEFKWKPGPKYIIIPIVLRLLYIPFFMLCNYRPDVRSFPVYINNDYAYFGGGITMAFTSGYFSSLCMMYAPRLVEKRWAGTVGVLSAFSLILGIVSGVNFSLLPAKLIEII